MGANNQCQAREAEDAIIAWAPYGYDSCLGCLVSEYERTLKQKLIGLAVSICKDLHYSEDAVQDTFVQFFRTICNLDSKVKIKPVEGFLVICVISRAKDRLRKIKSANKHLTISPIEFKDVAAKTINDDFRMKVRAIVDLLESEGAVGKAVVYGFNNPSLTQADIVHECKLGISVDTFKQKKRRLLEKVRKFCLASEAAGN